MPSGMPSSGRAWPGGEPRIGLRRHRERLLRRLDDEAVEHARLLDGGDMRLGQFDGESFSRRMRASARGSSVEVCSYIYKVQPLPLPNGC